jgi:hypothetical protein
VFRGWFDFGGGSMADMGIYSLWPVFTALDLSAPVSAEAWATHACQIVGQVSKPMKNDFSYPAACTIRFKFAPRTDMPALELFWYDGGMRPRLPAELEAMNAEVTKEGILFIGEKGMIMAGYFGESPQLYAGGKREPLFPPQPKPVTSAQSDDPVERNSVWRKACTGGSQSPGSFMNAGPISDTVNLGTIALRSGQKVSFDSDNMKITNVTAANKLMYREYRKGWEL